MIINSLFSKSSLKDKLKRDVTFTHYLHSIGTKCSHIVKCYYSLLALIIQFYKSVSYFISTKQLYVICFFMPFISYYNTSFSKFVISIITCLPSSFLFFAFIGMCILFIIYVHTLSLRSQITPFKFEFFKVIIIKIRLFPLSIRISLLLIMISLSVYFVGNIFFFLSTLLLSLEVLFEFYIPFYFRVVISLIFLINFFKVCFIDLITCKLTLYSMGFILCLSLLIIIFTHKSLVIRLLASFFSTLIRFFIIGAESGIIIGRTSILPAGGGVMSTGEIIDFNKLEKEYKQYQQNVGRGHGSFFKGIPQHDSILVSTSQLAVNNSIPDIFSNYYGSFMYKLYTTYEPLTIGEEVQLLGTPGTPALGVTDFGALATSLNITAIDSDPFAYKKDAFYMYIMRTVQNLPQPTLGDIIGADHLAQGNYNYEFIFAKTFMEVNYPKQIYTLKRGLHGEPDFLATFHNGEKLYIEIGCPPGTLEDRKPFDKYLGGKHNKFPEIPFKNKQIVLSNIAKSDIYASLLNTANDKVKQNVSIVTQNDVQNLLAKYNIKENVSIIRTSKYGHFSFNSVHEPPSYVIPYKKGFPIISKFKWIF